MGGLFKALWGQKSTTVCEFCPQSSIHNVCMHTNAMRKFEADLKIFGNSMNSHRSSNLGGGQCTTVQCWCAKNCDWYRLWVRSGLALAVGKRWQSSWGSGGVPGQGIPSTEHFAMRKLCRGGPKCKAKHCRRLGKVMGTVPNSKVYIVNQEMGKGLSEAHQAYQYHHQTIPNKLKTPRGGEYNHFEDCYAMKKKDKVGRD